MTITDRDKKILLAVVPLALLLAYWFLLLAPKRKEASKAGDELAKLEQRRDDARAEADRLEAAKSSFASDYAELVRLGKAIPSSVDMASLLVQLDRAAAGTGIKFARITTGERTSSGASPGGSSGSSGSQPPPAPGSGNGSQPAAAGGAHAQSGPGRATESAGNATTKANDRSATAEKSGVSSSDTQTSTSSGKGGLSVGGGATGGGTGGGSSAPAGLDTVPLTLEFRGDFFNLADFFHRLKRFVRVMNDRVLVSGRLLGIDGLNFSSDTEIFPRLKAEIAATVYLAPKSAGGTAGATPQGPGGSVPASAGGQSGASSSATTPTAAATPTR